MNIKPTVHRAWILLIAMTTVVLVAGCSSPATDPATSSSGASVTATEAPEPPATTGPAVAASGAVVSPKQGGDVRKALMDAARVRLATTSQFYVLAISSDGAWALAALRTVDGGKGSWVAFRNEIPAGWVAFWSGDVPDAGKAVKAADSRFADAVLTALDLEIDVTKPTVAEAEAAVLKLAKKAYPSIPIKSATAEGIGSDAKGQWWVQAWTDAGKAYENEQWFAYYTGTTWKLKEYGTGLERSDLPSDIEWEDVP
ncbi:MAG: hypothetical protein Q7W16_01990 [Coriobacteriia bacterium]|nr:hypothetical protein [Coriobacteriia bacterium]